MYFARLRYVNWFFIRIYDTIIIFLYIYYIFIISINYYYFIIIAITVILSYFLKY